MAAADELLRSLIGIAIGAVGGSVGTIVALRTWRYQVDRDMADLKGKHDALEAQIGSRLELLDRRQILQLRIIADIARKVGVAGRFDDLIVQLLATETEGS